jgi:predicted nucleic acid-binding Zn ribbon protein
MPLVHCRTCGNKISDTAPVCPKCGEPQNSQKKKSNNIFLPLALLLLIAVAAILYFRNDIFPGENNKIIIPEGTYVLEKSPDKGVARFLEAASSNLRGLGDHLVIYGDSVVQSTGMLSNLLANLDGGSTKFKLQKTGTDNQFQLILNANPVPLELTATKEIKITIGSTSLMYQKQ